MSKEYDISYTQNRELSWLKFNERVLEEANDEAVPLYERLKFISIFTSNLDEFYMIRVGSLVDLSIIKPNHFDNKTMTTAKEQLKEVYSKTVPLYNKKDRCYEEVERKLREHDISNLKIKELEKIEKNYIDDYFKEFILHILSPQIIDVHHPFPHLTNKSIDIVVLLKCNDKTMFGIIPVPTFEKRIIMLPGQNLRYVLLENVIYEYADKIFEMYETVNKTIISVTRNADISPDDESFDMEEDFRYHMKKVLKKRERLAPVRLEVQKGISNELKAFLSDKLHLSDKQLFISNSPLDMSYVFSLEDKFSQVTKRALTYGEFKPQDSIMINKNESMIKQVLNRDIILSFPYEKMDPFLSLIKEAANDPDVISIKITIYRLARKAKLIEYLVAAAENNKDVTVLMELRARFDEQNNIDWSETLEEAGCKVIYGLEGFKVHSKICLITRRERNKIQYITQVGTGNYNEKTAHIYTDLSLITSNEIIGTDAVEFFKNIAIGNLDGEYALLKVAPKSLKTGICRLIEDETEKANNGLKGRILLKLNSLTDREIIDKLAVASKAGVKIEMIIRGICCLLPGIEGKTDNISIQSIVGEYLEHSRIFCFGEGKEMKMYISSADFMTRNTEKRVEIACPILDEDIKKRIYGMLQIMLSDNVKARTLRSFGNYVKKIDNNNERLNCQEYFMEQAINNNEIHYKQISEIKNHKSILNKITSIFRA